MRKWKSLLASLLCICMVAVGLPVMQTQATGGTDLLVTDNYPDLDGWLESLGEATTVKVTCGAVGSGTAVIPQQVTLLSGWDKNFLWGTDEAKTRQIGYNTSGDTLSFAVGSHITVQYIDFRMTDKSITIPQGASVTFVNCTFSDTIVNNGAAIFNSCTFSSGDIENNGSAQYIGGTVEPENLGTPIPTHIPLGLSIEETSLDGVMMLPYSRQISYEISGTNKGKAVVELQVTPEHSGISAEAVGDMIVLSGTPSTEGIITITVTAKAGDENVSRQISLIVHPQLSVSLDGELDCVISGQTGYQDYLDVFVTEGDGGKQDYDDYSQKNSDAVLEVSLSPADSGMSAYYLFDSVVVAGTPAKAGTYYVSVSLTDQGQTVSSNSVPLRIYTGKETLKERFSTLESSVTSWDMEPYEIRMSDHAVVPVGLKTIYGSHESGLYGIIGNNQSVATDTLVIPEGCDVTFVNMKFYSSVKIIVERGGSLTLSDSVAFGPIEVHGGTFSMNTDSALTDTLTLYDGSVLQDAEIDSNARFLTDGAVKDDVNTVVIVNGTVTVKGTNSITGDDGAGSLPGQTALQVNGELSIDENSSLTVKGGGDNLSIYAPQGGTGLFLNGGTVSGQGALIVYGGTGNDGPGGDAISGNGKISVSYLESTGGDSQKVVDKQYQGGDAISQDIIVYTENPVLKGGAGDPAGSADVTKPHTHTYGEDWEFSASHHWHECPCGDKSGLSPHVFGASTILGNGMRERTCAVCGYTTREPIPSIGGSSQSKPTVGSSSLPAESDSESKANPSTGDRLLTPCVVLLLIAAASIGAASHSRRKSR